MVRTLGLACVLGVSASLAAGGAVLRAGTQQQVAAQIIDADGQPKSLEAFAAGELTKDAPGLVLPKVRKSSQPSYTSSAMRQKVQGQLVLYAIVGTDGKVTRSAVAEPLHAELDTRALETLSQWEFEPGRLNGVAVRVAIEVRMAFKLH
jgi:TonB family protein